MDMKTIMNGNRMEAALKGKLDTVSSPKFEEEILSCLNGITELVLDFKNLEYISSAGLRALLTLQQTLEEAGGTLYVRNLPQIVKDVFEVTGFDNLIPEI